MAQNKKKHSKSNNRRKTMSQPRMISPAGKLTSGKQAVVHFNVDCLSLLAFLCIAIYVFAPVPVLYTAFHTDLIDDLMEQYLNMYNDFIYPATLVLFCLCLLILVVKAIRRKRLGLLALIRENPVIIPIAVMMVWMLLSTHVNNWNYWTIRGTITLGESVFAQMEYIGILIFMGAVMKSLKLKYFLIRSFVVLSAVLAVTSFTLVKTIVNSDIFYDWIPSCPTSVFTNINYYGYYLSVAVPLALAMFCAEKNVFWKIVSAVSLAVNAVVLSYNNTMGAWVGCTAACVFLVLAYIVRDRKIKWFSLVAVAIFLTAFCLAGNRNGQLNYNLSILTRDVNMLKQSTPAAHISVTATVYADDAETAVEAEPVPEPTPELQPQEIVEASAIDSVGSGRIRIWRRCMYFIKQYPWFGVGFEGIHAKYLIDQMTSARPHNEFLQYALFYGIPGGILYIVICLSIFIRAVRKRAHLDDYTLAALTAAFGYLVGSTFGLTVYNAAPYLFIMLGFGYVHSE